MRASKLFCGPDQLIRLLLLSPLHTNKKKKGERFWRFTDLQESEGRNNPSAGSW